MKKQLMNILLILCMALTMYVLLPATAHADEPNEKLYQVGTNPVYRSTPNGDIIGKFPDGTILEVTEIKGDWAKVKYEGKEYYMWAARLTKVGAATTENAPQSSGGGDQKIEMAKIPAGSFTMGKRVVTISKPFYMGIYPVTQEQYKLIMGNNPSLFQGTGTVTVVDDNGTPHKYKLTPASGENPAKRPVERVNWYNAIVFCNKLSIKEGLSPAYRISGTTDPDKWGRIPTRAIGRSETWDSVEIVQGSTGYRLPTEAQWEYACRAGTTTTYNTGDTISDSTGWYSDNSDIQTHEVGKKTPNAWGLYDMHGNVLEWCWNWYCAYPMLYAQTDPTGSAGPWNNKGTTGHIRSYRGGSFIQPSEQCTSAWENGMLVEYDTEAYIGFRIMRPDPASLPDTGKPVIDGMVWIPGGTFTIGSPASEAGRKSNENQQQKTVDGFYMGMYEVTQEQYGSVMQRWPSYYKRPERIVEGESYDHRPVEQVSWYNALVFCNKLSMQEGLSPAYRISGSIDPAKWGVVPTTRSDKWDAVEIVPDSNGYRLPTEVQWEYACRAGSTTTYNTGKNTLTTDKSKGILAIATDTTAWYSDTSGYRDGSQKTHEVGMLAPNAWGLYDMHGNVSEWGWDATSSGSRLSRGGNFLSKAEGIRSAFRGSADPSKGSRQIGIRLVRPYSDTMLTDTKKAKEEPTSTSKTPWKGPLEDGWYILKLHEQNVVFNSSGVLTVNNASVSTAFYVENKGNNKITIKTADGKYVGISDSIKNGTQVKKVSSPYLWYITFESGGIRPAKNTKYVAIIAEGYKYSTTGGSYADGSRIALTQKNIPNKDNPELSNARFKFYSTPSPKR
jgi:formylglycine-generating enzyme required for sulfatase activity